MGKISRWFKSLLSSSPPETTKHAPKRRWSFVKSYRENHHHHSADSTLAAATAVAQVAVASAQRMMAGQFTTCYRGREWAAVKIQSGFRGYLSRRALKALKALVKVQALVRGNLVRRKQTVKIERRVQALLRAQARASADRRSQFSASPQSQSASSPLLHPDPATPEKFDYAAALLASSAKHNDHLLMFKRNSSKSSKTPKRLSVQHEEERSDKILEIDTGKPRFTHKQKNLFQSPHYTSFFPSLAFRQTISSPSYESQPVDCTPTKSDGSISNGYYERPNYLTCTESSRAKMRSMSAPKQRMGYQFEGSCGMVNKYSMFGELKGSSGSGYSKNREKVSGSNTDRCFGSRAYPGSGRLDKLGMPVNSDVYFSGGAAAAANWNRY